MKPRSNKSLKGARCLRLKSTSPGPFISVHRRMLALEKVKRMQDIAHNSRCSVLRLGPGDARRATGPTRHHNIPCHLPSRPHIPISSQVLDVNQQLTSLPRVVGYSKCLPRRHHPRRRPRRPMAGAPAPIRALLSSCTPPTRSQTRCRQTAITNHLRVKSAGEQGVYCLPLCTFPASLHSIFSSQRC